MGRFAGYVPCPNCRARGADRRGDNLATYQDGSSHCFACGYHRHPKGYVPAVRKVEENHDKETVPRDFTREIPAGGWKWLLQYGLPYSYWKPYCGYSESTCRLVITHGKPIELSVGRYIGTDVGQRKWREWGDKHRSATVLEPTNPGTDEGVIVVEDLVSAHVVRSAGYFSLPIFGTSLYPKAIAALRALKRPTRLWLDPDQWGVLAPKINRLQTFLDVPVAFIRSSKDPKKYSPDEIKEFYNGRA